MCCLNDKVEKPIKGYNYTLDNIGNNGFYTFASDKVIAHLDILGTSKFYEELNDGVKINEINNLVKKAYFDGYLKILRKYSDNPRYSIHIISDAVLIVPKSEPKPPQDIITYKDFFNLVVNIYKEIIFHHPCKALITKGQYFSTGLYRSELNKFPGGNAFLECHAADKEICKGPGIFSRFKISGDAVEFTDEWCLINLDGFINYKERENIRKSIIKHRDTYLRSIKDKVLQEYEQIIKWVSKDKENET